MQANKPMRPAPALTREEALLIAYGKGKLILDIIAVPSGDQDEDLERYQALLEAKVAEIRAVREYIRRFPVPAATGAQAA